MKTTCRAKMAWRKRNFIRKSGPGTRLNEEPEEYEHSRRTEWEERTWR
jgi:hypothetical protein